MADLLLHAWFHWSEHNPTKSQESLSSSLFFFSETSKPMWLFPFRRKEKKKTVTHPKIQDKELRGLTLVQLSQEAVLLLVEHMGVHK